MKPGDTLGPCEILSPIGKLGMGQVYRAHDPRLKRDVAIKVSAAQFSERFGPAPIYWNVGLEGSAPAVQAADAAQGSAGKSSSSDAVSRGSRSSG
jgi:hypothetical protein